MFRGDAVGPRWRDKDENWRTAKEEDSKGKDLHMVDFHERLVMALPLHSTCLICDGLRFCTCSSYALHNMRCLYKCICLAMIRNSREGRNRGIEYENDIAIIAIAKIIMTITI